MRDLVIVWATKRAAKNERALLELQRRLPLELARAYQIQASKVQIRGADQANMPGVDPLNASMRPICTMSWSWLIH